MASASPLVGVAVLERDNLGESMCSWCYPTLGDLEPVVLNRARMDDDEVPSTMLFSKFKNTWIYILPMIVNETNNRELKSVELFSIALISKTFDPEKHEALARLMSQAYRESGDPLRVLEGFLSVFAKGAWEAKSSSGPIFGKFVESEHDARVAMLASSIKALVGFLGQESIYLWHAVLCKKRVCFYSSSPENLQHNIRAVPLLVWHRPSTWQALRPLVDLDSPVELADLKTTSVYIAGCTDSAVRNREELFDLFVDLDAGQVVIPEHSMNDFLLCSVHKDIGKYMAEAANTGAVGDQQDMIKGLCTKTKQLLGKLESLKQDHGLGKPTIARQDLDALGGKNMDTFLWQVANAESMTV